jgi:hypothetical protein
MQMRRRIPHAGMRALVSVLSLAWPCIWNRAAAQTQPIIGLYAVPAPACSLVAASGFDVVHSYEFELPMPADSLAFVAKAVSYLDSAQAFGLQVLLGVPRNWLANRETAALRAVIRSLRDHPAVLSWYEDEVAQNGNPGAVEYLAHVVTQEDPRHGLVIEEAIPSRRLQNLARFRMFTYYPVTEESRRGRRLQTLDERFPVQSLTVPFWPVLQAFGRDLVSGPARHRLLTPSKHELEFSLNSALIGGATGIFFYPYLHATTYSAAKAAAHEWAYGDYRPLPLIAPTLWSSVVECCARAHLLLELLMHAQPANDLEPIAVPKGLEWRQWRTDQGVLLLAANANPAPCVLQLRARPRIQGILELRGVQWCPLPQRAGILRVPVDGPGAAAWLLPEGP